MTKHTLYKAVVQLDILFVRGYYEYFKKTYMATQ